jgi:hypothetical protein
MGPIRQSLAVTIGAVKPESKKQRPPQRAGRTGAPAGELRQPSGTTDYVRASVVELAARSEQAERSL